MAVATLGHKSLAITGESLMHISTLQPAWLLRAAFIDRLVLHLNIHQLGPPPRLLAHLVTTSQLDGVSLLAPRSLS